MEGSGQRYCGNCGAEISSGISFCTFCGRSVNGKLTGSGTTPKKENKMQHRNSNNKRRPFGYNVAMGLAGTLVLIMGLFGIIIIAALIMALIATALSGEQGSIDTLMKGLGLIAFFCAIFYIGWNLDKFF